MTEIAARLTRPVHRLGLAATVAISLALVLVLLGSAVGARAVMLRDSVLPGVRVAGVEVGGLARADAEHRIAVEIGARLERPIELAVAGTTITARPSELFALDPAATEAQAFAAARGSVAERLGAIAVPFLVKQDIQPVLDVKPAGTAALTKQLDALTRRPLSAHVEMKGLEPLVLPGRKGTRFNEAALLNAMRGAALRGLPGIETTLLSVEPRITTAEAEEVAGQARAAVAGPVELRFKRKHVGELAPRRIAGLLRFQAVAGAYELAVDSETLSRHVAPLVERFTREPRDATFRTVGKRARVVPDRPGTVFSTQKTAAAVLTAAVDGDRVARVGLEKVAADFTKRDAKALGIRHQVSTYTTLMGPSSANRIWNVQLLGRYLDGTILKPGQVFSYNKVMGPRTAERGFREGQMIWNGVLVPSIGGGVCQTATTIFNAAFEAGMPILNRRNHAFYISHYPMGRDATVSWEGSDFVFKNDLDHAILIKAHGNAETFTVTFYGTKQRRRVVATTSTPTNYTQPHLQYAIDPSAPPGSVRTADGGGPGFSVNVHRKVFERGKLIREDNFPTTYTPQNPTRIYGPGATPPGPYFYLPSGA
jgi:vancomycin resistance protein YoaR